MSDAAFQAAADAAENTTNKMMSTRNMPFAANAVGDLPKDQRAEERAGYRGHRHQALGCGIQVEVDVRSAAAPRQ